MSLSFWLRDYLYIPLGGSRGGALFVCRNLMITMLLGGLWHGAAWNYVAWGALHGVGLCANKLNDRGYEYVVVEDCVGSYFPEFQEMGLRMIKAQGGIFGWVASSEGDHRSTSEIRLVRRRR